MQKLKKSYLIYIPLLCIFVIQIFDTKDQLLVLQYILLGIMCLALLVKWVRVED
jgi:hypothetical protein